MENASFLAKKILDKNLSVRQSENLVRILKGKKIPNIKNNKADVNLKELEQSLSQKTGLNTIIMNKKNNNGSVTFEYKDLDQLNRIIETIKLNY